MAIYSFCGTAIQILITDENATIFNRVAKGFEVRAPKGRVKYLGQPGDIEIFNKVSAMINGQIDLNGGVLPYSDEILNQLKLIKVECDEIRQTLYVWSPQKTSPFMGSHDS